ncbi:MAG: type II toxin-antitoxin system HicA family toxin [Gammaproteobacteria bacterium]|jgi:hypothetical protein
MSNKHARLIEQIFQERPGANIHWREIESLLRHLGVEVANVHGAAFHVVLNGVEGVLHRPHHGGACSRQEVRHVREFLAAAGVTPSLYGSR